ncbi:MAG TPA: hypothetical protein PKY59_03230 [Pyrinomonadaceae bacterium]|nr:hypothetical protein [Pyrinomonadaceae bacterium]
MGLILWGSLLLLSDFVWETFSPNLFGEFQRELRSAILHDTPFTPTTSILIMVIIRSAVYSTISGGLTSIVARDTYKANLILGVFLIIFGLLVNSLFWKIVPIWFHFSILLLFIPFTMLGGKLISITSRRL